MKARGERSVVGDNQYKGGPVTVTGPPKNTEALAKEMGVSKSTYEKSAQIARREEIMKARGERAQGGGYRRENDPATVAGSLSQGTTTLPEKTTKELADNMVAVDDLRDRVVRHRGRGRAGTR